MGYISVRSAEACLSRRRCCSPAACTARAEGANPLPCHTRQVAIEEDEGAVRAKLLALEKKYAPVAKKPQVREFGRASNEQALAF